MTYKDVLESLNIPLNAFCFLDKLLLRMKQGLGSSRYAAPDYEKLKALALDKKIAGNRTLIKVNSFSF